MSAEQFVKLPVLILERNDLSHLAKVLYAVLRDRADADGVVSIGVRRLAKVLAVTPDTLQRAIRALETTGLLQQVHRGRGRRNQYRILLNPEKCPKNQHTKCPKNRVTSKPEVSLKSGHSVLEIGSLVYEKPGHVSEQTYIQRGSRTAPTKGNSPHHELIKHFTASWGERFGGSYPFDSKKDPPGVKRLLESVGGDLSRAKRIVAAYLADSDPYLGKRGYPLSVLASNSQIGRYITATAAKTGGDADAPPTPAEHPIIADARRKGWGKDVDAHRAEWVGIVAAAEAGKVRGGALAVKRSNAQTGADFRQQFQEGAKHVAS